MARKKTLILILVTIGLAGFGLSFAATRFLAVGPKEATGESPGGRPGVSPGRPGEDAFAQATRLEERHLYDLIGEVRKKLREADRRDAQLALDENRVKMVREELKEEAQRLEDLRVQVAAAVAGLKEARAQLQKDRVAIQEEEEANLKRLAGSYNTMSAEAASAILESMCHNDQQEDAVKILRYMNERNVGKVLSAVRDPALAARLSDGLKRIQQSEG